MSNRREEVLKHLKRKTDQMADQPIPSELFDPITFNECMNIAKDLVVPKMLFSEFWYEGEVSILFANTNLGKSILAVQIGDSISSGRPIDGLKMEAEKRRVLYFDFELSLKQLEARYSQNYTNHYRFDDDFIRVTLLSDLSFPDSIDFEDYLCQELENLAAEMKAKVLIIDNLTHLKNETERAKDALPLMKRLKNMANRHGLSILVIAHTPKRDAARPLSNNDLQGSKMLSNFCDSAFAIGKNLKDKHLRYIKQVKQRMTAELYDGENVFVCELTKGEHDNFTGFKFLEMGYEYEHLRQFDEISKEERNPLILKMHKERKSSRVIGEEIGLSHTAVQKILDKLRKT